MNLVIDNEEFFMDDAVIFYSVIYSSVTVVFAMAVLSKFLTNEFRFGFRSVLSLIVLFLGEPLCQFMIKGPGGVAAFAIGCLLVYSILPPSHLPVGNKTVLVTAEEWSLLMYLGKKWTPYKFSQILSHEQFRRKERCDSGFGNALVKKLDSIGMHVFAGCLDTLNPGAIALSNSCSKRVTLLKLDVTKKEDIAAVTKLIQEKVTSNGLWGLVNNAGVWYFSEMEMTSDAVFQKVMDTNVFGTVRLTRSLLPLIRQAKGRIINVTSLLGRISMEGNGAYGMSKHALVAYSDTLRHEMKKWGVFVSMIEPTGFHTASMHEQSLINKREEIWNSLDASTQESYGKDYLDKIYDTIISTSNRYPDDLTPVVRAMRSGLLSKRPRERYPCGVGAETLTILYSILPTWLSDKISLSLGLFPRDIQPAALHH